MISYNLTLLSEMCIFLRAQENTWKGNRCFLRVVFVVMVFVKSKASGDSLSPHGKLEDNGLWTPEMRNPSQVYSTHTSTAAEIKTHRWKWVEGMEIQCRAVRQMSQVWVNQYCHSSHSNTILRFIKFRSFHWYYVYS